MSNESRIERCNVWHSVYSDADTVWRFDWFILKDQFLPVLIGMILSGRFCLHVVNFSNSFLLFKCFRKILKFAFWLWLCIRTRAHSYKIDMGRFRDLYTDVLMNKNTGVLYDNGTKEMITRYLWVLTGTVDLLSVTSLHCYFCQPESGWLSDSTTR